MNARQHVTAALRAVSVSLLLVCTLSSLLQAQTPGFIYKPASSALGKSVLDPNGDGFTSPTNSGFSGTDYGTGSELRMIPIPVLENEPLSDLTTGSSGGHTDIASAGGTQSCYILKRTVNSVDYLVIRFRLGGASTASKGYSLLIDSDNAFGTALSSSNLGFDREIVYETGTNGRIAIYKHELNAAGQLLGSYNVNEYSQRSVALSTAGGNADYFYDFFVPLSAVQAGSFVRFTAVTVTSAGSGVLGTISDFNGVDDAKYGNNPLLLQQLIINSFPSVTFAELDENFNAAGWLVKTQAPTVNHELTAVTSPTTTSISGTSTEADGTTITVFKNGVQIGTTTVTSNAWSLTGVTNLAAGDLITATALATGKTLSNVSNSVIVAGVQECYIAAPVIGTDRSTQTIRGTWSGAPSPTGSNIKIELFTQVDANTINSVPTSNTPGGPFYVASNGTWTIPTNYSTNVFNGTNFIAKAVLISSNCTSGFSNVSTKTSGQVGVITPAPTVTTSPIFQSSSAQTVNVSNNGANAVAAVLILYVNGAEVTRTPSTVAAGGNHNFSIPGLQEGDVVSARAQSPSVDYWISNVSNLVTVQLQTPTQTSPPVITGTYTAGSGKTIMGTSTEASGTVITVYKASTTLMGTTTVTAFGTWSLTGQTLATNDVLTATAKALNKSLSNVSNSVTVQASAPTAPSISGTYIAGAASISGSSGNTLVRIYVDGSQIGTATPSSGAWTLSGLASSELYKGAVIHATNVVSGIESPISNTVTVSGVASFVITRTDGSPLGTVVSGDEIPIKITAKDAINGGGNTFGGFHNKKVTLSGTTAILQGEGDTENFTTGVLGSKTIALGGVGNGKKVMVVNPEDPTAFGEATVNITEALWKGTAGTSSVNTAHNQAGNWTHNRVPAKGARVKFAPDVIQDMVLEAEYTWQSVDMNNAGNSHNKNIVLNGFNLTVDTILNRGNSVVKTLGAGKLKMHVPKGQSMVYPVSNSADNFVTITNNTAENDSFAVRVFPNVYMGGTSGTLATSPRVNVTWDIDKTKANGGSGVNFTFNWLDNQVANGPISTYYVNHYRTTPTAGWEIANGTLSSVTVGTGGEKIMSLTGYPGTFSPFTIGGSVNALPVTLVSFEGTCQPTGAVLNWTTESEIFNDYYTVERSENLTDWEVIKTVPGAGNSNQVLHYSTTDDRPLPGISYYRLKQTDYDGQYEYKGTVAVSCISQSGFTVFPNPGTGIFNLSGVPKGSKITLLDMMGKPLWQKENGTDEALQADLRFLDAGTYIMQVRTGAAVMHHKIVVSK